jgi:protein TonB
LRTFKLCDRGKDARPGALSMATQPVEIHLQLAALARTTSAPIGYVHWSRTQQRRPWGWEYLERLHVVSRVAASRLRAAPRPSWPALLLVALAASLAVWWVMHERMPAIDPQAVIATHLAAADEALADRRYLEPLEHSALHHYRTVLALDPANARARSGVATLTERFVEDARSSILDRRLADAVVALDGLRRVAPDHRRLALLDVQLRRAIDEAASVRALEAQNAKAAQAAALAASTAPRAAAPRREQAPAPANEARAPVKQLAAAPPPPATAALNPGSGPTLSVANASAEPGAALAAAVANEVATAEQAASVEAAGSTAEPATPPAARKLTRYVAPDYPREALMRGIEGWVDLDLTINAAGDVVASNVLGGKARQVFDRAAGSAVRRWKYEPSAGGEPFQALQVRVTFALEK